MLPCEITRVSDARGIALPVAIFALVIVGALVSSAFFAATQEQRIAEQARRSQRAFGAAELGVAETVRAWNRRAYNSISTYPGNDSVKIAGSGSYGGYVHKLSRNLYLVEVTGLDSTHGAGPARQSVGVLLRIRPIQIPMHAALTVGAGSFNSGGSIADDNDSRPSPSWTDCDPDTTEAGVSTEFGDVNYAALAATADITLPEGNYSPAPAVVGDVCNTAVTANWGGGPLRPGPCSGYFPVVHISGNATLGGGEGQGMLLVDGDMTLGGGFQFAGVVIVNGTLRRSAGAGSDPKIWGVTLARSADVASLSGSGSALFGYSRCAATRAVQAASTPALSRSRSWMQLRY